MNNKLIYSSNQMSQVVTNDILNLALTAIYQKPQNECFYIRHMDDWIILTKTRSQQQWMVKIMHQVMQ